MATTIVTMDELQVFKQEIFEKIEKILNAVEGKQKQLLKNADVRKLLSIGASTLQTLRINGTLPYSKVGGSIYYDYDDVMKVVQNNRRSTSLKTKSKQDRKREGGHNEK